MNDKKLIFYMCGTSFKHDHGSSRGTEIFSSLHSLKKSKKCWKQCGVVEFEPSNVKWIHNENFKMDKD